MCAAAAVLSPQSSLGKCAVRIAPGLLEEIRDRVLDGYAAAPHGGVEVGFVLLGRNGNNGIVIEHFREIPCAHLLSPRFLLSPEEETDFPQWMEKLSADPELDGADLLGWGCSHNRSELALLDREIAFYRRYFLQPEQFVMVVKPESMQAVVAGVFLPDERDGIRADSPTIKLRSALLDSALSGGLKTTNQPQPQIVRPLQAAGPLHGRQKARRFRVSKWWLGVAGAGAFLAVALASGLYLPAANTPHQSLSVDIRPQANDLVFTWKGTIDRVKFADIAVLDGNTTSHFDITGSFQRAGVFVFPHRTANVQVVLTARTSDGEVVRSIGLVDGRRNAEGLSTVDPGDSSSAAARLDATNRRLAALVSILESRWKSHGK